MLEEKMKYKLVTRSDFDGLACAVLLNKLELINDIKFVHPKDVQDGKINLTGADITTNLPYVPGVHLAFDHHSSELLRVDSNQPNYIISPTAPSTARVIFDHFGGQEKFSDTYDEMLAATDKADSARYSIEDVLHPDGWVLLSFITDPRSGLGRFKAFQISNYDLMMEMISYCEAHTIDEILELPAVKERSNLYFEQQASFQAQLQRCAVLHKNLIVLDLRREDIIYAGNRFMIYALFPECDLSMHVIWGVKKQNIVFAVGKSIFNRMADVNIGALMLNYGGGGHVNAGTCQIDIDKAEAIKQELIAALTAG